MLAEGIRWTVFALGILGSLAGISLHVFVPGHFGRGRRRAWNLLMVPCSVGMAVGAWYQSWLGWAAAVLFAVTELVEVLARWRFYFRRDAFQIGLISFAWSCFLILLVTMLLIAPGRAAFGMAP